MEENYHRADHKSDTDQEPANGVQPVDSQPPQLAPVAESPLSARIQTENPATHQAESQPTSSHENEKGAGLSDMLMVVLTGLIFLATAANVLIFYLESESTGKQIDKLSGKAGDIVGAMNTALSDSRDAISKAFKVNEDAVKANNIQNQRSVNATLRAAADTNKIAQQTLEAEERPWLGFTGFDMKDNIEAGKTLAARAAILNGGRSPAVHVRIQVTTQTICGGFPNIPTYPMSNPAQVGSISLVMPNIPRLSAETSATFPLTADDIAIVRRNDCNLYGYARVTYSDTLDRRNHWRHMCVVWDKSTPKSFNDCDTYNDGDEDYPDGKEPN